jgi:hypothetical protein
MTDALDSCASRVITQRVACTWQRAYALAADPLHLPDWASGLANSALRRDGDHWVATTPQGAAILRFAPANEFGVLDHWVMLEGLEQIYLPFRVIDAGPGVCEFQFTLFRQPHMDAAAFARDAEWVARDLQSLRQILEAA